MTCSFQVKKHILPIPLLSLNEHREKSQVTIISKQALIKVLLAYNFLENVFHWSRFKAQSHEIFFS